MEALVGTTDRLRHLPGCLAALDGFPEAAAALTRGQTAEFDGAWGSSCALLAAELLGLAPSVLVVVVSEQDAIDRFCDDFELFSAALPRRFPAWESDPGERQIYDEIYGQRLATLKELLSTDRPRETKPRLVVTSIQSLLQPVASRQAVADSTRAISTGETFDIDDFSRWLVLKGFHATSAVELPGEFSVRGGIVDVFAPDWQQPVRIELFDNEVESLRTFEVSSQRSVAGLERVELTLLDLSARHREHFASFLPPDSWFLLVEPDDIQQQAERYAQQQDGPGHSHKTADVWRQVAQFATASAAHVGRGGATATCHMPIESVERFSGDIGKVRDELDRVGEDHDVYVVSPTSAEVERLGELLSSTRLAGRGRLRFPVGYLDTGFRLVQQRILVITGRELFHRGQLRRTPRRRLGKAIDSFLDLQSGGLVVHLAHGIGRYRGLELLNKDGRVEEHLIIEFHGGTRLFVPASRIDLVQKYVGGSKTRPGLSKIGGRTWVRQKQAAAAAVEDLASDMLAMQAERASRPGIGFEDDSQWQREFDASFPYEETPDQLDAIAAIKQDMMTRRPMDRLLCGDVGFGKTELAMRSAFKAVDCGYQVAVLVPTTILAEQHFQTFQQRMAEFPFDIARLSRFCSTSQQREVLEGLKRGQIDIVIGTHRLASKDVQFYNLGLIVIDEEQRFGVEVKERLKSLRSTVDVLTMSATPIPRTLHMSLVGLRDISNLETPPADRLAIETRVTRFNAELIRHAVLRELNRGGQVFFVHNRVQDIELLAKKLQHIVPEASIRIGHGQMPEDQLEQVMVDFVNHRFDMLLATTIVESGLDIPNANTIFVDEADRYGLADLHQLRGRVGRYKHHAYCYMLIDPRKHLTPNAAKRLRAIEEFSEMGAGFSIAMRDLEIRGAGNLLGTQQSGHIAAVGYELYCQLLENAVRVLQKMPPSRRLEVDIELPGEAYLPHDYVDDMRLKVDIYRRLARVDNIEHLGDIRRELMDRFGELPAPVERMLERAELRIDAAIWQVAAIQLEAPYLRLRYQDRRRIEQLAKLHQGRLRVVDHDSAYLTLPRQIADADQILQLAKSVLRPAS